MSQTASSVKLPSQNREKRKARREAVSLPVLIESAGRQQSAQLHNLSESGAMIESTAPLRPGSSLLINCGTIGARAVVVWEEQPRAGVQFVTAIDRVDIAHQVVRSNAAASRRERRKLEKREDGIRAIGAH